MIPLSSSRRIAVCAIILASALPIAILAQASSQPRFDVSTVRSSDPNAGKGMTINFSGESLKAGNITLYMLIRLAYDLSDDQISGGPSWLASRRFDIAAKTDQPFDAKLGPLAAQELKKQMLQQLLADRFQLKLHHGAKDIAGYRLTVAKGGAKGLQPDDTKTPSMSYTDGKLEASAATMDELAYVLALRVLQSPVSNTTGLTGRGLGSRRDMSGGKVQPWRW